MNSLKWAAVTPAWSRTPESCLTVILFDVANLANDASTVGFRDIDLAALHLLRLEHLLDHLVGRHLRRGAGLALQLQERRTLLDVVAGDRRVVDDILDLAGLRGRCGDRQTLSAARAAANPAAMRRLLTEFIASSPSSGGLNSSRHCAPYAAKQWLGGRSLLLAKPLVFEPKSPIVRNETLKPMLWLVSCVVRSRVSP